jgi:thiamine transport system ATP-binding protein
VVTGAAPGPGLHAEGIVVRYGGVRHTATTAVDDVTLDVAPGEIVVLLGASGSGKSSLLRGIAGLEPLASGRIRWGAEDLTEVPVHRRGFGVMFQDGQLFPHRDVGGNVAYGLAHLPRAERERRVAQVLALVGMAGFERRAIATLSGGQAQRVALARSLAPSPRLLMLDEPLSALDRALREHLAGVLRTTLRSTGTTALYVTHDQDEAFAVADRVAVMEAGRVSQIDTPEGLWAHPASRAVAAFLGYGPFLTADDARALGWRQEIPAGMTLALAPGGLVATDSRDDAGARVRIVDQVVHRGHVSIGVTLPGGVRASARSPRRVAGATVGVRLDPASCVLVPA